MTDLTSPPTDRATCGWLPLPAGPPPSPPPDRIRDRPAEPGPHTAVPAAPAPARTAAPTGPPPDDHAPDHAPDPAAVQAAIETLTRWLRCGGMLVCSSDDDAATDPGRAHPAAAADPGPGPAPGQPGTTGRPPGTTEPAEAACRQCRASDDPVAVRAWARERGFRVADRGRLPAAVVAAYVAAHPHP
ncbi:histone-like nucleoid-structuring protein Lsr2 [Cellulosimicrobium cellulans]|uniref:Lsr2 family DNA-binding protein n=1 Tax=Cellulosimicrobium cellulans TaxID=1710 RepID=UPI00130DE167|nr:histone-like nucleoid-structuring protein Lsr2 [Cellulosimicrobium cellulans]